MKTNEIIEAIKNNDSKNLVRSLYKIAFPPILIHIKQKGGQKSEAEDCFQDALVNLIKVVNANKYDENYEVKNYLFVVARNIWYNKIKRMGKVNAFEDLEVLNPSDEKDTPEVELISEERKTLVSAIMNQLGEKCKQLLTYTMFEKRKLTEVVSLMGFSNEGVVKTNNYRCKKKLKELFKENQEIKQMLQA